MSTALLVFCWCSCWWLQMAFLSPPNFHWSPFDEPEWLSSSRPDGANAKALQRAVDNLDAYLAATQLGITISSLALGWIGEPALARLIEPFLSGMARIVCDHRLPRHRRCDRVHYHHRASYRPW